MGRMGEMRGPLGDGSRPGRMPGSRRRAAVLAAGVVAGASLATGACVAGNAPRAEAGAPPAAEVIRPRHCKATEKLIPTCGAWWGIAPEVFTRRSPAVALERAERRMGRKAAILHVYHRNDELFPTPEERELAKSRILLINWKVSLERPWAEIAAGRFDRRIDRLARYIKRTFPKRFFLTIHHEPEDDVRPQPGSGRTARDYAAMFRHVVTRLRERGVTNAVTVMTYMGAPNWASKRWFADLYPGDDVVDWVAIDPYADHRVRDFAGLVNKIRPDYPNWPGFYKWMQARFPGKPFMVAEWGVFEDPDDPHRKERIFRSVARQIHDFPQIKALVYFDSPRAPRGDTRFDTTPGAARAFTALARSPHFTATPVP
ncbi:glycosyl hydrolase family 26 [Thermopolyspora flexuosa]|uniref:Glycosyl hydrolase family 26 n=2 Tax=Thermopolyspora flexuosa TaxID=103836 RepID=A0A543IST0_9ACTN|nr:glycosyl hydrolase family 26 [Thermopolyspora flexuosa]